MYVIDIIKTIIYVVLLVVCAYTDYKKGKIYNKYLLWFLLIYSFIYIIEYIVVFLIEKENLQILNKKLIDNLLGFVIAFVISFIFYILGIFKGGDAKLLSIVGLFVGMNQLFTHFSIIIIVAGIVALIVLIRHKILLKRLKRVFLYFRGLILTGHFEKYTTDVDNNVKFPFAIYILFGEIISYIYILIIK